MPRSSAPTSASRRLRVRSAPSPPSHPKHSVVFAETVAGAVALRSFSEMLRAHCGVASELSVVDSLPGNAAVTDILKALENPLLVR